MESGTTCWEADEGWELYNDDGFVYKRKQRRRDPVAAEQPASSTDPEAEERNRKERKRRTLLKLKAQYQREIDQWELLSNSLRATEEKACHSQRQSSVLQKQQTEREGLAQTAALGASPQYLPEFVDGLLVDELLLQVICSVGRWLSAFGSLIDTIWRSWTEIFFLPRENWIKLRVLINFAHCFIFIVMNCCADFLSYFFIKPSLPFGYTRILNLAFDDLFSFSLLHCYVIVVPFFLTSLHSFKIQNFESRYVLYYILYTEQRLIVVQRETFGL